MCVLQKTKILFATSAILAAACLGLINQAAASPSVDFVCFGQNYTAKGGFDLMQETAYIKLNKKEIELPVTEQSDAGFSTYEANGVRLSFAPPEGNMETAEGQARCHQTADSIKTIALYGKEGRYEWDTYNAAGKAFQNVRAAPSVLSDKVASFEGETEVTILSNTDQFLDGFFWFRIGFGKNQTGYIWGALLCTNDEHNELQSTLRRCN